MSAGPGPMFLQQNPHPPGTPEATEWDDIFSGTTDPHRDRRMARYLVDQRLEGSGAALRAPAPQRMAEQLAGLSAAGVLFGPDCSQFQGRPSWGTTRGAGCHLGGYKVSEGRTYQDPSHQYNRAAVPGAGLVPLAYHYLYASAEYYGRPAMWEAQADWYCSLVDPHAIHALDVEAPVPAGHQTDVASWVRGYRRHFPSKPLLIYTNLGLWINRSRVAGDWPQGVELWHAGYRNGTYTSATGGLATEWAAIPGLSNSMAGLGTGQCRFWQFTDHAAVPGVSGTCDGNAFLGTRAELEALATGDDDVPLTAAEKQEIITGAGAAAAQQVWATLVTSPFHGKPFTAATLLGAAYRYSVEASYDALRPPGGANPGTPTYAKRLMTVLATIAGDVDTLEESETEEVAALAALTPAALADAIAAKLGGSADARLVHDAVLDALSQVRLTTGEQ